VARRITRRPAWTLPNGRGWFDPIGRADPVVRAGLPAGALPAASSATSCGGRCGGCGQPAPAAGARPVKARSGHWPDQGRPARPGLAAPARPLATSLRANSRLLGGSVFTRRRQPGRVPGGPAVRAACGGFPSLLLATTGQVTTLARVACSSCRGMWCSWLTAGCWSPTQQPSTRAVAVEANGAILVLDRPGAVLRSIPTRERRALSPRAASSAGQGTSQRSDGTRSSALSLASR
jgi:hypothetical protein